jgi:hypothetical protein
MINFIIHEKYLEMFLYIFNLFFNPKAYQFISQENGNISIIPLY